MWVNRDRGYTSNRKGFLEKKLELSDVRVEAADLYQFLCQFSGLEELEMRNVHVLGSMAKSIDWSGSWIIRNIITIRIKYDCKEDKDIMNAGISLEFLKEWFSGRGLLECNSNYNVYVAFGTSPRDISHTCPFATEVMKFLSVQMKEIKILNLNEFNVPRGISSKVKLV